ncbi:MAG: sigma-70 family RNA polymerase sigma factor, partial [Myxococcales bacterium]|nr:sigma-70 family RNA polymerase sigma factor [Myxococcales bacterium]
KRIVFVMFEIELMSAEEIAAVLEIPVGTVYSRMHWARREFQRAARRLHLLTSEI